MRKILLAAMLLGVVLSCPGRAAAGTVVLGWNRGFAPPVVAYPYYGGPIYSPYVPYAPYAPYAYSPYAYGPSYFRPDVPYGWNAQRNWRDTWQDDGVKLHTYTFPGGATR
jgi:hypothetical protein